MLSAGYLETGRRLIVRTLEREDSHSAPLAMRFSKQVALKGLCAALLCFVVLQVTWVYWGGYELPVLSFHQAPPDDNVRCHGSQNCFPSQRDFSLFDLKNSTDFCLEHTTHTIGPPARLGTVTGQFGNPEKHYQRALGTHVLHNAIHGTNVHVLSTKLIDDLWNKPAFILDLLLTETEKPEAERLQWLFWVDRDTIILDNCRSPLSFLPPTLQQANQTEVEDPADEINLIATKDWNGLNNGVFLMRVNRWSIDLFAAILAHRHYRPDVKLTFTEQSAMELLLEEEPFRENVVWVPQWWFNAYGRGKDKEHFKPLKEATDAKNYHARRGDFLVHFAGVGHRGEAMSPWLDIVETAVTGWALEPKERDLDSEIRDFWKAWRNTTRSQ